MTASRILSYKDDNITKYMSIGKVPLITVIGTCRVHDPLRDMEELGLIGINNGGLATFVHSLPEILLRIEVMKKDSKYSPEIVSLQVGKSAKTNLEPNEGFKFSESDAVVIEISTLKAIFYQDSPLQFNEVNRLLCTPHGTYGKTLRDNIDYAFNNNLNEIAQPNEPSPETIPQSYEEIISNLRPKLMDTDEIESYLDTIRDYIKKPILFVNHINIEGANGKKITSRNRLCEIIATYCEKKNAALFNPSELFVQHDKKKLLAKDGTDLAHYAKTGLEIIGKEQYNKLLDLIQ